MKKQNQFNFIPLILIWLMQVLPVQAVSFDCGKAKTEIDNLICSNAKLSKLDEEMADAYRAATKQAPDTKALRARQRQWLKDLRFCKTAKCLESAYWARIRALQEGDGAKSYDTPELKARHEKDKAAKIKTILAQYPMRIYEGIKAKNRIFCQKFYEALRTASPEITYIEPVVRTDDRTHPVLGEYLACNQYEPKTPYIYFMLDELGRRGFRLYRADLDGNPKNGLEEYLYGEDPLSGIDTGPANLVRVDLQKCIVINAVPASPENQVHLGKPSYGFSALVQFQNQFYFYDLSHIGTGNYYGIQLWSYRPVKPGKKVVEIRKDIFVHYDTSNIFGAFSVPTPCHWDVPHSQ